MVCEETPHIEWVFQGWLHPNDDVQRGDGGEYRIIVTLPPLEIALQYFWVDLRNLGEANFIRFRSGRACSRSPCRSACKIDLEFVLTGIFGIGKDEFPRRKEVFPAVVYAAGSEDFGRAFGLESLDNIKVEASWENLFGWRDHNIIMRDNVIRDLSTEMIRKNLKGTSFLSITWFLYADGLNMGGQDDLTWAST